MEVAPSGRVIAAAAAADRSASLLAQRAALPLRSLLAIVLASAAAAQMFWPAQFGQTLSELGFFPDPAIVVLQFATPALEIVLAFALALGRCPLSTAAATLFVSLIFTGIHLTAYNYGVFVPFGCLGLALKPDSGGGFLGMLVLSIAMTVAAFTLLLITPAHRRRGDSEPGVRPTPAP